MDTVIIDVENTMYRHQTRREDGLYNIKDRIGSAFCAPQRLVATGIKWLNSPPSCILTSDNNYADTISSDLNRAKLVVGFNIKHDLHWLKRVGIENAYNFIIWDCQVAEFILESQKNPYPSLNKTCEKYDIPLKLDTVAVEYWDKGYDTDEIPTHILKEYLKADLDRTEQVFLKQQELFKRVA